VRGGDAKFSGGFVAECGEGRYSDRSTQTDVSGAGFFRACIEPFIFVRAGTARTNTLFLLFPNSIH